MTLGIKYKSGFKYQLVGNYSAQTNITAGKSIKIEFIELTATGLLTIKSGYAWDGPSGPTVDTKSFMRGSLCHDCFYQLIRMGLLEPIWREPADQELKKMCLEDGMNRLRAWYVYKSVQVGGKTAASPESRKKVHKAP